MLTRRQLHPYERKSSLVVASEAMGPYVDGSELARTFCDVNQQYARYHRDYRKTVTHNVPPSVLMGNKCFG
jgi:hypothetical protein